MGMSTKVVGIKPPDEKWLQMKSVWDACKQAKVAPPVEVRDFFNGLDPDPKGVVVDLGHSCVRPYNDDMSQGYEVDIKKLPPDVTIVRFFNSW